MQKEGRFWMIVFVCAGIWIWVSVLICITLNLPSSECINPYSCMLVCILSVWSPCIGHHILIISPWLNYSAACITLCMWYTINSQLTWAKKCQPIGCAITLLSDIFMLLVVTLTSLSHLSLWLIMVSIYFSVDLLHYISLFLSLTSKQFHHCDHFVTHHLFPLSVSACFLLASFTHLFVYDYICYSSDFYASLSPICLLFVEVKHVLPWNKMMFLLDAHLNARQHLCDCHIVKRTLMSGCAQAHYCVHKAWRHWP